MQQMTLPGRFAFRVGQHFENVEARLLFAWMLLQIDLRRKHQLLLLAQIDRLRRRHHGVFPARFDLYKANFAFRFSNHIHFPAACMEVAGGNCITVPFEITRAKRLSQPAGIAAGHGCASKIFFKNVRLCSGQRPYSASFS